MPLYCYMITFYEWEDSEFCPIFHEKKFTEKEFHKLCKEAYEKTKRVYTKSVVCYADDIAEYLIRNYGFTYLEKTLLAFNVNDVKTGTRRTDQENYF